MKRLTKRLENGHAVYYLYGLGAFNEIMALTECVDRLAAYEDTGLEPKQAMLISNVLREVGETYNCWFDYVVNCVLENSHLKDLAQAEKDGRMVVLPSDDYTWQIRGDLFLNIIRANCRAAHEEAEAALKKRGGTN